METSVHQRLEPSPRALRLFAAGFVVAALPSLAGEGLLWLWPTFCALFIAACGVDAWRNPVWGRLSRHFDVPERVAVGTTAMLECELHRPEGALSGPVEMTAELGEPLKPSQRAESSPGADGRVRLSLDLVPERRGEARIEGLWLRYAGPWGLMRRSVRLGLDHTVEITPDIAFVHSETLRLLGFRDARVGVKIERYTGDGTEFDSLRELVEGDDVRSIDWKASARHTKLLLRQTRAERNHQIYLAIDTGRLMAEPVAGAPLVDHAIHAALLLARVGLRHGDRVGLYSFADQPGLFGAARGGVSSFPALLQLTGSLAYSDQESNFTLALTELGLRLRRRSLVVVLTDFVDAVTGELMMENLLRLARRHLVIFVAFRDPVLAGQTEVLPGSAMDLHRAVVAESLVLERQVVLERLRRAGMAVVDAPPRAVGAGLVNRYLSLKRRERI